MKIIQLSQGKHAFVDDADYDMLIKHTWYACLDHDVWYAYSHPRGKKTTIKMHRIIMNATNPAIHVDHIDHNGLNNQRSNLRLATKSQNNMNSRKQKNCTSKFKGVYWNSEKAKWQVQIKIQDRHIYLGRFDCEIEAAKKYNDTARQHFGEFAHLNQI